MELTSILIGIVGLAIGFAIAKFLEKSNVSNLIKNAKKEAGSILKDAKAEAEATKKEKILHHIQDLRGGKLNDTRFGTRMKGEGQYADQIKQLFKISVEKLGLNKTHFHLSSAYFQKPGNQQMTLF